VTVVRVDTHRHTRPLTSWPHFAVIDSVEDYCCIALHTLLHNVYVHIVAVKVRFYFVKRLQCCISFAESLAKAILLGELFVFAAQTKVTSDLNFNNYKTSYREIFLFFLQISGNFIFMFKIDQIKINCKMVKNFVRVLFSRLTNAVFGTSGCVSQRYPVQSRIRILLSSSKNRKKPVISTVL
jgi:hypothetical protein